MLRTVGILITAFPGRLYCIQESTSSIHGAATANDGLKKKQADVVAAMGIYPQKAITIVGFLTIGGHYTDGRKEMITDNKYYAISLWDYSLPSVSSGTSHYYGTMDELASFIDRLSHEDGAGFTDTVTAFERYKSGEITATHSIAYSPNRLITPVTLLAKRELSLPPTEWTFFNIYGFPYYMKCDGGTLIQIVIRRDNRYFRCLRGELDNLYCSSDSDRASWLPLKDGFWGHPCMIETEELDGEHFRIKYALYAEEKVFASAEQAMDSFNDTESVDLSVLAKDIFGDG